MADAPGVEFQIGADMISEVLEAWLLENPGKSLRDMPKGEFSRLLLPRVVETAKLTDETNH